MGSLDWELCEFQSKDLLIFSSIVWKVYPFLLCDVSLRSMIKGESFVLSHDVYFEALLVELVVSGCFIVGMRVFIGGNLIPMNGAVSQVGYLKYGKVLLSTPSLVSKGVKGKDDDLGSSQESQVIHSLKEMFVVDESNVLLGKGKGIVITAPQVFEVMPLRYLGFRMVIFRQGFIHAFTGIIDALSNHSLFGASLLDCREERVIVALISCSEVSNSGIYNRGFSTYLLNFLIGLGPKGWELSYGGIEIDVMMNTLGMLCINFSGLVFHVEVEFGAKIRHVMSPDSGDNHDANLIGINIEMQDVIELVLNWLYEGANDAVNEDALGRLLVVTLKGCDQPAAMEASKKCNMFVMIRGALSNDWCYMYHGIGKLQLTNELRGGGDLIMIIMIGMGSIGLDYINEMNGDHCAGVGLRMKTASFEGIKTDAYGDIERVACYALLTDGLLRKSWKIVLGLLLMVPSRVFYHPDWEVHIGKIKLGTRCAYKVIMLSGYSKLMTGAAVDAANDWCGCVEGGGSPCCCFEEMKYKGRLGGRSRGLCNGGRIGEAIPKVQDIGGFSEYAQAGDVVQSAVVQIGTQEPAHVAVLQKTDRNAKGDKVRWSKSRLKLWRQNRGGHSHRI